MGGGNQNRVQMSKSKPTFWRAGPHDLVEEGRVLLPEANPRITTAISQQKRMRSPKIIYRKWKGREGGVALLHLSLCSDPARLEASYSTRFTQSSILFSCLLWLPPSVQKCPTAKARGSFGESTDLLDHDAEGTKHLESSSEIHNTAPAQHQGDGHRHHLSIHVGEPHHHGHQHHAGIDDAGGAGGREQWVREEKFLVSSSMVKTYGSIPAGLVLTPKTHTRACWKEIPEGESQLSSRSQRVNGRPGTILARESRRPKGRDTYMMTWNGPPRIVCPKYREAPTLKMSGI